MKYQYFYGGQMVEFTREEIAKIIYRNGIKLKIKPYTYKAVVLNVQN